MNYIEFKVIIYSISKKMSSIEKVLKGQLQASSDSEWFSSKAVFEYFNEGL